MPVVDLSQWSRGCHSPLIPKLAMLPGAPGVGVDRGMYGTCTTLHILITANRHLGVAKQPVASAIRICSNGKYDVQYEGMIFAMS